MIKPIAWGSGALRIIDQTRLPADVVWLELRNVEEVAEAINEMRVRGAPLIGVAAAFGVALAALNFHGKEYSEFIKVIDAAVFMLKNTRPTAVNLAWALNRVRKIADKNMDVNECSMQLLREAQDIMIEDEAMCRSIGMNGKDLLKGEGVINILTHCNAGALATAGWGTALGVIRSAFEAGANIHVYMDETRPLLQGARLTAWELIEDDIPCTLITDGMSGFLMQKKNINAVIVGADRIAANGDFANKIGTYTLAVLAKTHNVPFYVAAPYSSIDISLASGNEIPIEERSYSEITHIKNQMIAPLGVQVWNPAFDVTPYKYVTSFITEQGLLFPPFEKNLDRVFFAAK